MDEQHAPNQSEEQKTQVMNQNLLNQADQEETQKMYHHIPPYFQDGFEESKEFGFKSHNPMAPMSSTPDPILNDRLR